MAYSGRFEPAIAAIDRAARLEPLVVGYQEIRGLYLHLAG
jgi:hypothetical protein